MKFLFGLAILLLLTTTACTPVGMATGAAASVGIASQTEEGLGGTASDIKIQAEQMLHIKRQMAGLIAEHTGQPLEQIEKDSDRDRWFTAEQAKEYGFIDHVYERSELASGGAGTAG